MGAGDATFDDLLVLYGSRLLPMVLSRRCWRALTALSGYLLLLELGTDAEAARGPAWDRLVPPRECKQARIRIA